MPSGVNGLQEKRVFAVHVMPSAESVQVAVALRISSQHMQCNAPGEMRLNIVLERKAPELQMRSFFQQVTDIADRMNAVEVQTRTSPSPRLDLG